MCAFVRQLMRVTLARFSVRYWHASDRAHGVPKLAHDEVDPGADRSRVWRKSISICTLIKKHASCISLCAARLPGAPSWAICVVFTFALIAIYGACLGALVRQLMCVILAKISVGYWTTSCWAHCIAEIASNKVDLAN